MDSFVRPVPSPLPSLEVVDNVLPAALEDGCSVVEGGLLMTNTQPRMYIVTWCFEWCLNDLRVCGIRVGITHFVVAPFDLIWCFCCYWSCHRCRSSSALSLC